MNYSSSALRAWRRASLLGLMLSCLGLLVDMPDVSRYGVQASAPAQPVTIYDPNPDHIWNRLYDVLLIRQGATGDHYGYDSLDPLLWPLSTHLLASPSHERALRVLDEFLRSHAENLIKDPAKRAIMQRDLWAVFDWSAQQEPERPDSSEFQRQKRELQTRLAEVLRRLALSSKEIENLPNNYSDALASGNFAKEYGPTNRDRAFLPPDLFDEHGPWVNILNWGSEPLAASHAEAVSGRSRFLVFMRLPEGRKATFDYLHTLWNFPEPWVIRSDAPRQTETNPNLPSFPDGTEVALVRQMTTFDRDGNLVPAPITEGVQIRVYRSVSTGAETLPMNNLEDFANASGQDFYEFRLSRPQLFAHQSGGLRAVGRQDRDLFTTFASHGFDEIDSFRPPKSLEKFPAVTQLCAECHRGRGVKSLNILPKLLKSEFLQTDESSFYPPRWWENDGTVDWKARRFDWGLLTGYWQASSAH